MNTGLSTNNPAIVSAFQAALLHQGLLVLLIAALVAAAWNVLRTAQYRRTATSGPSTSALLLAPARPEPSGRRLLRIAFGLLWIFDGILQGQSLMPLGLVPQVVQPPASGSPSWVANLVHAGTSIWDYHPVTAGAAAVWVQVGIGLWLLAAPRGDWSRVGGVASTGWGLVVWVFGEAFGGVLAPGPSWLFGTPGAVLFYCCAGALIALPEAAWSGPRLGKTLLRLMGLLFVGMAVLQAWPGRGFWQGHARAGAAPGSLTRMVQQMAQTPQPSFLSSWLTAFGRFDTAHGWAVNLFVVVALAAVGAAFLGAHPRAAWAAVIVGTAFCLADWVLVQDLGFLGGVGTDPNSMVPTILLFIAGYLALTRAPAVEDSAVVVPIAASTSGGNPWGRLVANPTYTFRAIAAMGAIGVTLIGAVPMAAAAAEPNADLILAQALDGAPQVVNGPAPAFNLVDQHGARVSLAELHGKTVALTFLDDTCTTDCPVIASELRTADQYLGADARRVEMVAVNANPRFLDPDYLAAFDRQEGLQHLSNWLFLTGSLPELRQVWRSYGISVIYLPGGAMIGHSEYAYVIDPEGRTRDLLDTDPGPASGATESSFSEMLAGTIKSVMAKA